MSIAPPSDIVLDVAQAADPLKVQAATAKLASMASGVGMPDIDFGAILQSKAKTASASPAPSSYIVPSGRGHQIETKPNSTYQKFEAVVLQNFMQSILPKDTELFGDAFSADAYRSMLSEQLATQVAKSGRLGIAHAIEARENALHPVAQVDKHASLPTALGATATSGIASNALEALTLKTRS